MTTTEGTTTYQYDDANRLTSADDVTYTWDDRGNLVSDGTFTYAYNGAGRMAWAESVTSTLVYTYSAAGLRVAQSVDGDVTTFAWDWASGIPEMLNDSDNLYLVGHETLGRWDGSEWAYYLPDALGSVRQVADGAGAVVSAREWTPFGVAVGAAQAGLGYTGEWWDADVGLEYLRARWYDGQVGRFTRKDPFPGLRTQPFSLHSYAYVLANPVNATDPSGWYYSDVHYDLIKRLAFAAAIRYFPADVARKLADCIARGDQHVDDLDSVLNVGICGRCHFCPFMATVAHVNKAVGSGDTFLFGAALHQFQDFYAYWNEGYDEDGHAGDSVRAGALPWNHLRSPGGKSVRTAYQLDDFFEGGHYHVEPGWEAWVQSPYPAHPRGEVIAEIRRRNLSIDLNGLNNNDLIDLYLRREPHQDPDWQQRVQERSHFGIDPDAYVESSTRDMYMRQSSSLQIDWFMRRIAGNVCLINWEQCDDHDDSVIKALLTE